MSGTSVNTNRIVEGVRENNSGNFSFMHLSEALKVSPQLVSNAMVWGASQYYTDGFAITKLTEGVGNTVRIRGYEYNYPYFQGDIDPMDTISYTSTGTTVGKGFTPFTIYLSHNRFKKMASVHGPSATHCRIIADPQDMGDGRFKYRLQIWGANANNYIPNTDLVVGAKWERSGSSVEWEDSEPVFSTEVYPGEAKNQISFMRSGMKFSGHSVKYPIETGVTGYTHAVINIPAMVGGKQQTMKFWFDWKQWQQYIKDTKDSEVDLWISEYNKLPNGDIPQKGDSGVVIPRGDGLLAQIPNTGNYPGRLTANRFRTIMRDMFYNVTGAENKTIMMHTGTLGMDIFNEAMQDELKNYFTTERTEGTFISPATKGDGLKLGKYFTEYKTVDGDTVIVYKNPMFNMLYRNSPKYKGLPGFSGNFVFVDMSTYSGDSNISKVVQEGRERIHHYRKGIATMPEGYDNGGAVATGKDASEIYDGWTQGLMMKDGSSSYWLKLQNTSYYV